MSETVLVEDQGAVRVLTLNQSTKLNAMNVELVDTLIGAVRARIRTTPWRSSS